MKALLSREPGGPETLELAEIDDPVPGPGQLLVRVKACAINYPDVLIIEDRYQFKPPRPFAPGGEIAGTVEAVGAGVAGWSRCSVMAVSPRRCWSPPPPPCRYQPSAGSRRGRP